LDLFAEGENFQIALEDGLVRAKVWRRTDLDASRGAAEAERLANHFHVFSSREDVRGLLFDVRVAPSFMGQRTQNALGGAIRAFALNHKPVAVVSAATMQALQFERMLGAQAPLHGREFSDLEAAEAWLVAFHLGAR